MVLWHRRLPAREQYPLPPREITAKAVEKLVGPNKMTPATRSALTWLAHFGYGGLAGAVYAGAERRLPGPPTLRGMLFGLLVWATSYLGLLPGLQILTPATKHPARRNALMIAAHFIWGSFLAAVYQILFGDLWRANTAFHTSPRPSRDTTARLHIAERR